MIEVLSNGPRLWSNYTTAENIARFITKKCIACGKSIHKHWRLEFTDPNMKSKYFCRRDGTQWSPGLSIDPLAFYK